MRMTDKHLGDSHLRADSHLDAAIDRAVREMMSVEPRADLRQRVLAELVEEPTRAALWPRFAFGSAALAASDRRSCSCSPDVRWTGGETDDRPVAAAGVCAWKPAWRDRAGYGNRTEERRPGVATCGWTADEDSGANVDRPGAEDRHDSGRVHRHGRGDRHRAAGASRIADAHRPDRHREARYAEHPRRRSPSSPSRSNQSRSRR